MLMHKSNKKRVGVANETWGGVESYTKLAQGVRSFPRFSKSALCRLPFTQHLTQIHASQHAADFYSHVLFPQRKV
jgi:hypothetical protein